MMLPRGLITGFGNSFDYSNPYIVVKERTNVKETNTNSWADKVLPFKNNALFRSDISKTSNTFIKNVEDVGIMLILLC